MRISDIVVEVRDPSLTRVGRFGPENLVGATFTNIFNGVGSWSLSVPSGDLLGELLRLEGYGIIVSGPDGSTILSGPTTMATLDQTSDNVKGVWTISGATDDLYISERLAYPTPSTADVSAQTDDYDDRSGEAEFVIKSYISANVGPDAPTERRISNLVIEPNEARGLVVSAAARFDNLQTLISGLAEAGGIGYRTVQTLAGGLRFEVYVPTDRSSLIRMDVENRQLSSASLSYASAPLTRAIVAGKGEGKERTFIERTTPSSVAAENAWGRRVEHFIDSRGSNTQAELETAGDEALTANGKTITTANVTPSDDTNMEFGKDWFLGDKVTIVNGSLESVATVKAVGIRIDEDGVRVGASVGDYVPVEFEEKLLSKTTDIDNRVSSLEKASSAYGINTLYIPSGGTDGTQPVFNVTDLQGSFNRFGNMVHFQCGIHFEDVVSFGTGQYYVTIPYEARVSYTFAGGEMHDTSQDRTYAIFGKVQAGSQVMKLFYLGSNGQLEPFTSTAPRTLDHTDYFNFSATYEIEG